MPRTLRDLTATIEELETTHAPGSETALWPKYCEWARVEYGVLPYDDYEGDYYVDDADWDWWIDEYAASTEDLDHA